MPLDLSLKTASTKDALEFREKRFPVSNNCFIPIVGVTGSGKTTIIINLFRLLNQIYRYSHIIYVAANYRQDATLRAACLTQIVLEDEVIFEQEKEHTRHVYTASTDLLDVAIMKIYELQDLHAKAEELREIRRQIARAIKLARDEQPELLEDLLARYITITEEIDAIAPTSDGTRPKVLLAIDDNSGAKAFKVNSENNLVYRLIRDRRHHNTSVLACIHNLKAFHAPFRMHATEFIFTAGLNSQALKDIYEDLGNIFPIINEKAQDGTKACDLFCGIYDRVTGVYPNDPSRRYYFLTVFRNARELRENFDTVLK